MTAVENRKDEIGRVNVTDRDDRGTDNWTAKYFISNDLNGNFAMSTDPATNQGILTVVKVQLDGGLWSFLLYSNPNKQKTEKKSHTITRADLYKRSEEILWNKSIH